MSLFERYLTLWVALAMAAGMALGSLAPGLVATLAGLEIASINLVVAVLIWAMIWPMMVEIDFASLRQAGMQPKGLVVTLAVNWLVKPFTMAALAVLFFEHVFAPWIQPQDAAQYIAGAILLGAAPCTAMVFVWSRLVGGDPAYTLVQVSVNDLVMIVAFAPIVALLLGVTDLVVPWDTLLLSVLLYVVVPLAAGMATRRHLLKHGPAEGAARLAAFSRGVKPLGIGALLATVTLLFGFQGEVILRDPVLIAMIATPLILQGYAIFALALLAAWAWRIPFPVAAPCALIGTSNFFELAVAVAIGLFGLNSGAALVTVVGVLVEVPVMLSLVALARRWRAAFPEAGAQELSSPSSSQRAR